MYDPAKKINRYHYRFRDIGQSTLEFVMVIPFVLAVCLLCVQLGYIVYLQNTLEQSAREGCRIVCTTGSDKEAVRTIKDMCPDVIADKVKIDIDPGIGAERKVGDLVKISLSYDDSFAFKVIKRLTGWEMKIESESLMRMECNR